MGKIAIIDLGTNTFHLLIVDLSESEPQIIHKEKVPVKIGEGGIEKGYITPEAMERALKALHNFHGKMTVSGVTATYAFATSAFRNASNGRELAHKVKEETGIHINIISGDKEAELIYEGVKLSTPIDSEKALIMDIGGGSVEFIIGDDKSILWKESFEIGGQRLMDRFHQNSEKAITQEGLTNLNAFLDERMQSLSTAISNHQPHTLIGASGTFDTLCEMYFREIQSDLKIDEIKEYNLPIDYFHKAFQRIIKMNREERMKVPGMIPMRVNMIVVAMGLIDYVLKNYDLKEIKVSTYALKEGVLNKVIRKEPIL